MTSHLTYSPDSLSDDVRLRRGTASVARRLRFTATGTWFDSPTSSPRPIPAGEGMTISIVQQGLVSIVAIDGAADLQTVPQLSQALAPLLDGPPLRLIVDLTGTTFLACAAMAVLDSAHAAIEPRGMFAVVARGPRTAVPLRMAGLHRVMRIYPHLLTATIAMTRAV